MQLLLDAYDQSEGATNFDLATNEYWGAYYLHTDLDVISGNWDGPREAFDRLADWVIDTMKIFNGASFK